jgi:TB2/DP1, HVA22 family
LSSCVSRNSTSCVPAFRVASLAGTPACGTSPNLALLLRSYCTCTQIIVSWIPFYYLGKCALLVLLIAPDLHVAPAVFHRAVIPGIEALHHAVNHVVIPNAVDFIVGLPWRLLVVIFPAIDAAHDELICDTGADGAFSDSESSSSSNSGDYTDDLDYEDDAERAEERAAVLLTRSSRGLASPCTRSRSVASAKKVQQFASLHRLAQPPPVSTAGSAVYTHSCIISYQCLY